MLGKTLIRKLGFGLPLVAIGVLVAACGGNSTAAGGTTTTTTTTPPAASSSAGASGAALTLKTDKGSAGIWLTGVGGRALYVYTVDKGKTSECYGGCAAAWPPLTTTGSVSITGQYTSQTLLGVTTRTDGTQQVTYGGHPLYYFTGDTASGQTNGQGYGGQWFLVGPIGNVMNGTKPTPTTAATPGAGY